MDADTFWADRKTQSAVERELLIIAEASVKLRKLEAILEEKERLERVFPSIPWNSIGAMGNHLRHEYGRTDPHIVWETVSSDNLAALARAISERYAF